jgi:hypothetical protein
MGRAAVAASCSDPREKSVLSSGFSGRTGDLRLAKPVELAHCSRLRNWGMRGLALSGGLGLSLTAEPADTRGVFGLCRHCGDDLPRDYGMLGAEVQAPAA